jgi:hypothetical protein
MQKWHYKTLVIRELALCEAKLNAEGEKGWELVSVCINEETARAFFRQPADPSIEAHVEVGTAAVVTT